MSFVRRLGPGLRFILNGKSTVAALRPSWESRQPHYATSAKYETLVREGYRRNELIYACINKASASASQLAVQLRRKRDKQLVNEHPFLDLIHHPNDTMNESDLWSSVVMFQKRAGRAAYEIELNNRGLPIALWPLIPNRLRVMPGEKRPVVAEYIYEVPGMEDQHLPPSQMLDFPIFDPLNRFTVFPPVAVAARAGDIDNAATDHIKLTWEHGGMPQGLLKTTQVLTDTAITDTRRRWRERYGGRSNWLEPAILDRDQEYQKIAWSFEEMGFDVLDAREEARICMVFDVPPILVGAKVGLDRSTYANYKEARRGWWEDTLMPMYENFIDVLDRLLRRFDPDKEYEVSWNLDKVRAFQEETDAKWKRATEALRAGAISKNEFYREVGMETIGPAGDVYIYTLQMYEVPQKKKGLAMAARAIWQGGSQRA